MFDGFEEQWTPIQLARNVRAGHALRVIVAGHAVALFRTREGRLGALSDRCPHRGASLSLGEVRGDRLACPFHGWELGTDGACERVPMCDLSAAKRARLGTLAFPTREIGGLVWMYTGTDARGSQPEPAPSLVEPGWVHWTYAEVWRAHWTRAMENMLDVPHLPFVHRRTIGRGMRSEAASDPHELTCRVVEEPYGMRVEADLDGAPLLQGLEWRRPNGMVLHLDRGRRRLRQHVFCVPIDEERTRMILVTARDFGRYNPLLALFDRLNPFILAEDRGVVESIRPLEAPPASEERSVGTDAPTLFFRRYYHRELRSRRRIPLPRATLSG